LEDKLHYLRYCQTKQKYTSPSTRKRRSSVFAPNPPALQLSREYADYSKTHGQSLKALQEEEEKLSPNEEVVANLMKKTFFIRRRSILKCKAPISVANLLKIYPSLRNCNQVSVHTEMFNIIDLHH